MEQPYRVLIVDDEPLILSRLSSINWSACGTVLAGTASNGREALVQYRELRPDILITDIGMPLMDGIELISRIRAEDAATQIILLTVYDDFSYAKRAISLGVTDYLLKGFYTESDIQNALLKAVQAIRQLREGEKSRIMLTAETEALQFSRILERRDGDPPLPFPFSLLRVMVRESELESMLLQLGFIEWAGEVRRTRTADSAALFTGRGQFDVLLPSGQESGPVVRDILDSFARRFGENHCMFVSEWGRIKGWDCYARAHESLLRSMELSFYTDSGGPLPNREEPADTAACVRWMQDALYRRAAGGDELRAFLEELRGYCVEHAIAPKLIKGICAQQLVRCKRDVMEVSAQGDAIDQARIADSPTYTVMSGRYAALIDSVQTARHIEGRFEINKAIEIIEKNLDQDISLTSIAQEVGFSPGYLSHLFKKNMGINYKDFVADLRMKKAAQLLRGSNLKVYEVAARVGFPSYRYFSAVFQEHYGVSPKKYKEGLPDEA